MIHGKDFYYLILDLYGVSQKNILPLTWNFMTIFKMDF